MIGQRFNKALAFVPAWHARTVTTVVPIHQTAAAASAKAMQLYLTFRVVSFFFLYIYLFVLCCLDVPIAELIAARQRFHKGCD
jgi:hypothetical protein